MIDRKTGDWLTDSDIDALLAEAAAEKPDLPAALSARILGDADAQIAARADARKVPVSAPRRRSGLRQFLRGLGGTPAMAGFAAATVAGIWVGLTPPAFVTNGVDAVMGTGSSDDFYIVGSVSAFDLISTDDTGTTEATGG